MRIQTIVSPGLGPGISLQVAETGIHAATLILNLFLCDYTWSPDLRTELHNWR